MSWASDIRTATESSVELADKLESGEVAFDEAAEWLQADIDILERVADELHKKAASS